MSVKTAMALCFSLAYIVVLIALVASLLPKGGKKPVQGSGQ